MYDLPIISLYFTPAFDSNSQFYFLFLILETLTYKFLFPTKFMSIDFAMTIYQFPIINFRLTMNRILISNI